MLKVVFSLSLRHVQHICTSKKVEKYNLRSLVSFIGFLLAALVAAWVVVSKGRVREEVSLVNSW